MLFRSLWIRRHCYRLNPPQQDWSARSHDAHDVPPWNDQFGIHHASDGSGVCDGCSLPGTRKDVANAGRIGCIINFFLSGWTGRECFFSASGEDHRGGRWYDGGSGDSPVAAVRNTSFRASAGAASKTCGRSFQNAFTVRSCSGFLYV